MYSGEKSRENRKQGEERPGRSTACGSGYIKGVQGKVTVAYFCQPAFTHARPLLLVVYQANID